MSVKVSFLSNLSDQVCSSMQYFMIQVFSNDIPLIEFKSWLCTSQLSSIYLYTGNVDISYLVQSFIRTIKNLRFVSTVPNSTKFLMQREASI